MKPDDHKQSSHFDASMPLPDGVKIRHSASDDQTNQNPAADIVRQRVSAAYANAPSAEAEIQELVKIDNSDSKPHLQHQKFIAELMASGKSLPEIQTAWHEYYAGLTDGEKHRVWQEFYASHGQPTDFAKAAKDPASIEARAHRLKAKGLSKAKHYHAKTAARLRQPSEHPVSANSRKRTHASPLRSLLFGLGIGSLVILIFLFSFFNERFIAPFIQPSRTITNTPIISDTAAVSASPEIIIPKINVEIPVVYTVTTIDQNAVENALEDGVVHYADTALPGQNGNLVIVGHSSNNIFNQGKYKFAFVLLSRLDNGDTFYLQKDGVRYTYQVYQKEIVNPNDVSVLGPQSKPATASLITCDPPGTSTNRLVVVGQQIDPNPNANLAAAASNSLATKSAIIPSNSPSLWSRIVRVF